MAKLSGYLPERPILLCQAALCYLRKKAIIRLLLICPRSRQIWLCPSHPYAAAKWGVVGLTKSLSIELGADNIRVNAILPGLVAGDRQRRVMEAKSQQLGVAFSEIEEAAFSYSSIKDYVTAQHLADQIFYFWPARAAGLSADRHFL